MEGRARSAQRLPDLPIFHFDNRFESPVVRRDLGFETFRNPISFRMTSPRVRKLGAAPSTGTNTPSKQVIVLMAGCRQVLRDLPCVVSGDSFALPQCCLGAKNLDW